MKAHFAQKKSHRTRRAARRNNTYPFANLAASLYRLKTLREYYITTFCVCKYFFRKKYKYFDKNRCVKNVLTEGKIKVIIRVVGINNIRGTDIMSKLKKILYEKHIAARENAEDISRILLLAAKNNNASAHKANEQKCFWIDKARKNSFQAFHLLYRPIADVPTPRDPGYDFRYYVDIVISDHKLSLYQTDRANLFRLLWAALGGVVVLLFACMGLYYKDWLAALFAFLVTAPIFLMAFRRKINGYEVSEEFINDIYGILSPYFEE